MINEAVIARLSDETTRCVECHRILYHTPDWTDGVRCFGCINKDDPVMQRIVRYLKEDGSRDNPRTLYDRAQQEEMIRFLWNKINPGLK